MKKNLEKGSRVRFWCKQYEAYIRGTIIGDGPSDLDNYEVECEAFGTWYVPHSACICVSEDP